MLEYPSYLLWEFWIVPAFLGIILTVAVRISWDQYKMIRSIKSDVEAIMIYLANEKMERDEKNCGE